MALDVSRKSNPPNPMRGGLPVVLCSFVGEADLSNTCPPRGRLDVPAKLVALCKREVPSKSEPSSSGNLVSADECGRRREDRGRS